MSTTFFISIIAALLVTVYLYVKSAFSYWKRKGVPFIEPSFPFGNFGDTFLQKLTFGQDTRKAYQRSDQPFVGLYSFTMPTLLIRNPKIIRDIFIKEFDSFDHRGTFANEDVDPMAANLLLQRGEKWKNARTKFSPAFSSGKLKQMFENITECTNPLKAYVDRYCDQQKTVEIRDMFARYATNVIASVGFGIHVESLIEDRDSEFRKHGKQFFEPTFLNSFRNTCIRMSPFMSRFFRVRYADKKVGEFMINTVKQNLEYREKNNVSRKDFFQMLMQLRNTGKIDEGNDWSVNGAKKALSLEEMTAQAFVFFVAGYESSATTMSFCMYELAKNPKLQKKAYEDIVSTLDKHNGQLTYESLADMIYIENCINETLRMHTPFGVVGRQCVKNYKVPDYDIVIEKGTKLLVSIDGLHYDEQYYEHANEFIPERFDLKRNGGKPSVEMPFFAFGAGPRNCVGQRLGKLQSKVAIITLLQKYRFELGEQHSNKELVLDPQGTSKLSVNGINLKVFSR